MLYAFVGTIANIYLTKKMSIVNRPIEGKNNMFLPENCHTQKRAYSLNTHPKTFIRRFSWKLEMAMAPYRYTAERIAKR